MTDGLTISTLKPANAAFDYEELRKIGIQHIERTASALWTDYNIHDPGITTLELLCYAVTDLSYRATNSIPNILATEKDTAKNVKKHFFSAKTILPNSAVTVNDYRKLIIDIKGVKNAWLKKTTKPIFADIINKKLSSRPPVSRKWESVPVKGFYNVLIEFDTNIRDSEKNEVKTNVRNVLSANRNICEDFLNIEEINKQGFRLCCEIEVNSTVDVYDTIARMFFNIQLHLTPVIKFYQLKELLDQGHAADVIFEGPLLTHGFIKDEELINSDLKTEIHLSDLMSEILKDSSVQNILDIRFNAADQKDAGLNKWIVDVMSDRQPVLDILESNILVYREGNPFRPKMSVVKTRFENMMSDFIEKNDLSGTDDITFETGSFQDIESYYSIQNHYPKNYGIGPFGLPGDATNERKVQARQLQGYLYFFDQQLANYFSQMANLGNLLSFEEQDKTYFTKLADTFKDSTDLFVSYADIKKNIQSSAEVAGSDEFYNRRNQFLDHLLARFSESFFDFASIQNSEFPQDGKELITAKMNFLKGYPEYSSQRFKAYNYSDPINIWDSENVSGMEKRLERLLGFQNLERRSLVNIYSASRTSVEADGTRLFWFEVMDNQASDILLIPFEKSVSEETAKNNMDRILSRIKNGESLSIVEDENTHTFTYVLKNEPDKVVATSSVTFTSAEGALEKLTKLTTLLRNRQSEEGMFVIEHVLMLPSTESQIPNSPPAPTEIESDLNAFMPICVDENCDDCDSTDPYSFRISVVLPAYSKRFLNMDFRRYCERTIRMETPSHIYPKICWVNNEQLREFETAYQDWLSVKAANTGESQNGKLAHFVNVLNSLKTVYPVAKLEDCGSIEEKKLFLLNQNALGTLKS